MGLWPRIPGPHHLLSSLPPTRRIGISGLAAEVDGKSLREMRAESLRARSQRFPEASINQNNSTWSIPGNSGTEPVICLT